MTIATFAFDKQDIAIPSTTVIRRLYIAQLKNAVEALERAAMVADAREIEDHALQLILMDVRSLMEAAAA